MLEIVSQLVYDTGGGRVEGIIKLSRITGMFVLLVAGDGATDGFRYRR